MPKYRLICPECSAVVITAYPEAVIWERCPACKRHMWDHGDVLMADRITHDIKDRRRIGVDPESKM